MRPLFTLGNRLQKCADFVRPGVHFADIGTDHGYLPIWLMKTGRVPFATAADINPGPLAFAKSNAEKYGADIRTMLSDGLREIPPETAADIVIAGMGGELIAEIIRAALWLKNSDVHLILQPMSAPEKLRAYLFSAGFTILREEAVTDGGKVYSVILAAAGVHNYEEAELYMGAIVPGAPNSSVYAALVVKRLAAKARGSGGTSTLHPVIEKIERLYLENDNGTENL